MPTLRVLVVAPLLVLAAACGSSGSSGSSGSTAQGASAPPSVAPSAAPSVAASTPATCPSPTFLTGAPAVPSYLPKLPQEAVFNYLKQGKTRIWDVTTTGGPSDIVKLRDRLIHQLEAKGFTLKDQDAEPGHEAEAEYGGAHDGHIRIRNLCRGSTLQVRYVVES